MVFDGSQPLGSRVVNITIRCIECDVPRYSPLDLNRYYRVVSQDFIGNGGGGYTVSCCGQFYVLVYGKV